MDANKVKKIDEFRSWLIEEDICFLEKANGHFQIFGEAHKLAFQVWATTEKMLENTTEQKSYLGIHKIMRELSDWKHNSTDDVLENPVTEVRKRFLEAYSNNKGNMFDCILVVAVYLPSGATEIITNHYEVESKMEYYINNYDEEFRLKANPKVKITGFMLV